MEQKKRMLRVYTGNERNSQSGIAGSEFLEGGGLPQDNNLLPNLAKPVFALY